MARRIVITSGKGGVGKTTITANLGLALAVYGARTLLIDVDLGLNNLDLVLGIENKAVYDIIDVLEGRCRAREALIRYGNKNLFVMPSNHSFSEKKVSPQQMKVIVDSLELSFDYILIDCPAGIDAGFHRAVALADEAIVVTTPHLSALRDADKVLSVLGSYGMENTFLLINKVRGDLVVSGEMMSHLDISGILKLALLGIVPEEDKIFLAHSPDEVHTAFKIIASNLIDDKRTIYNYTDKYEGLLGGIRRSLKRTL